MNYPAFLLSVFIIVAVYVCLTKDDETLGRPRYPLAPELPHVCGHSEDYEGGP